MATLICYEQPMIKSFLIQSRHFASVFMSCVFSWVLMAQNPTCGDLHRMFALDFMDLIYKNTDLKMTPLRVISTFNSIDEYAPFGERKIDYVQFLKQEELDCQQLAYYYQTFLMHMNYKSSCLKGKECLQQFQPVLSYFEFKLSIMKKNCNLGVKAIEAQAKFIETQNIWGLAAYRKILAKKELLAVNTRDQDLSIIRNAYKNLAQRSCIRNFKEADLLQILLQP